MNEFLNKEYKYAVVGVSRNKEKYGYKIFKAMKNAGFNVYAINPNTKEIDGEPVYPSQHSLPERVDVVVTVVPPHVTENVIDEAFLLGIKKVWMQPGSESDRAVKKAKERGMKVMYGLCLIVDGLGQSL